MTSAVQSPDSFPVAATDLVLAGPAGRLEATVDLPEAEHARAGVAILCHPHPLHGGTLRNKVVTMLDRSLRELGLATVRFNFRGVGASEGTFDDGDGEMQDLLAVAQWVQRVRPGDALWLAGFSFGSYVAAKAARHLPVKQLILIAPPVQKYPIAALPHPPCPWLVVQGEDDDVVDPQAVFDWVAHTRDAPVLVRMPQTGHFFHRKLMDLRGALKNAVKGNLPPAR
jgi:alpha/beta superfamily hydrolase